MKLQDSSLFRQHCYIDGKWVDADDGATFDVLNPADGSKLGTVPEMGTGETARAISAADAAMSGWAARTAKERAHVLRRWYDLIIENQQDLAVLMVAEMGKPMAEALGEIAYSASFVEWFGEEGKRIYGDTVPTSSGDRRFVVIKQPIGVVAAITPWNFPSAMITRKCAPALAAGCSVVIKPAEDTPYSALALAELAERAGIPKGVFNIVTGVPAVIGAELTSNPTVRKLSFTGSTAVGKLLMKQCADTVKKVSLELGGNAPFIVFNDADMDSAVEGAMTAKMRHSAEVCTAANRMFVEAGVADEFTERLAAAMGAMKVGPGNEEGVTCGPMINAGAIESIDGLVQGALAAGATAAVGGARIDGPGFFYSPTVLGDVTMESPIAKEEIFGPVAPVIKFTDTDTVIDWANDTELGLASYVFSGDVARAMAVGERIQAGMVGINRGAMSDPAAPFGGMKQSGLGREGAHEGIFEFCETQYIAANW